MGKFVSHKLGINKKNNIFVLELFIRFHTKTLTVVNHDLFKNQAYCLLLSFFRFSITKICICPKGITDWQYGQLLYRKHNDLYQLLSS
jgi:hypothetical protein